MNHLSIIGPTSLVRDGMDIAVVVPTLNEAGNIGALLDGILAADPRLYVVVIDDGSTDGTIRIVEQKAQALTAGGTCRLYLIARGHKLGYASAVQDGMRFALAHGARRILQMDADFSHDPAALPALLAQSESQELVIGSRYIPGGGTCGWSLKRRLLSRGANTLARTLLRLPLHDCTGGFRCWHADLIERCGVLDSAVQGYAFLFLTLDRCRRSGARIGEVPILFSERRSGRSKMNGAIIREAVGVLFRLWLQHLFAPPVSTVPAPTVTSTEQRRAA